jgi:hypothetical protein
MVDALDILDLVDAPHYTGAAPLTASIPMIEKGALAHLDQMLLAFSSSFDQAATEALTAHGPLECSQRMEGDSQPMQAGTPRQHCRPALPWDSAGEELGMPANLGEEREVAMTLSGTYTRPQPVPARLCAPEEAAAIASHSASFTQVALPTPASRKNLQNP